MVAAVRWLGAAVPAFLLTCLFPLAWAQAQQPLAIPTPSFEQLTSSAGGISVVTPTPIAECPPGVPCAHVLIRENVHYVGITTLFETDTDYVTITRDTTITRTITSTKTLPGHDCTVYRDVDVTRMSTTVVRARTTSYVTKDNTVTKDVVVYETEYAVCTSKEPAPAVPTGSYVPGTSIPGTSIPGTSIPGTSIPGTAVPGTSIPGTSIPGTSIPGTSIPGTYIPGTTIPGTFIPGTSIPATTETPQPLPTPESDPSSIFIELFTVDGMTPPSGAPDQTWTAQLTSSTTAAYPVSRTGTPASNPHPGRVMNRLCGRVGRRTVSIVHGNGYDTHEGTVSGNDIIYITGELTFDNRDVELKNFPNLFEQGDHPGLAKRPGGLFMFPGALWEASKFTVQNMVVDFPDLPYPFESEGIFITLAPLSVNRPDGSKAPDRVVTVPLQRSTTNKRFVSVSLLNLGIPLVELNMITANDLADGTEFPIVVRQLTFCRDM